MVKYSVARYLKLQPR